MGNMSYARFQNTLEDLWDCEEHLHDRNLDEEESRARDKLIRLCREIADQFPEDDLSPAKRGE